MDRRVGHEVLRVLSPLGVEASIEALQRMQEQQSERSRALQRQLEQAAYETRRAFEQYDEVDPRNRLVAEELERRWNVKLEAQQRISAALAELPQEQRTLSAQEQRTLSAQEQVTIRTLGRDLSLVWHSADFPVPLKKRIVRTVIEEVLVDLDETTDRLQLLIHWKGGCHTSLEMDKPRSGAGRKTSMEDVELIGRMAGHGYGDDEIARALTKLGRRTGKGNRWTQQRVAACRRQHGLSRAKRDHDVLTLAEAARLCGASNTTIRRMVDHGVLAMEQVAPWAPWEIRRADLERDPGRTVLERLKQTGKLVLDPTVLANQLSLLE